jgi:hypothetical protein
MATQSLEFIGIKHRWINLLVYTIVFAATYKSSSAAPVIATISIVDQHVRARLGKNHAPWHPNGIKKAIAGDSCTPNVSGITEAAKKLK